MPLIGASDPASGPAPLPALVPSARPPRPPAPPGPPPDGPTEDGEGEQPDEKSEKNRGLLALREFHRRIELTAADEELIWRKRGLLKAACAAFGFWRVLQT